MPATASVETQTYSVHRCDVATQTAPTAEEPECSSHPECDTELWFEDGNLALRARNTEFRVYKGTLIKHSPAFREILSDPHSHTANTLNLRCWTEEDDAGPRTVVHLPDSPEDLGHFLRLFFSGDSLNIWALEPTFHQLSAYIRLGTRYRCEQMVQRSLEYLKRWYTDTRDGWFGVKLLDPPRFDAIHVIGVVNLARLTRTDSLLPSALMVCCLLGGDIVSGFTREDGTQEQLSAEDLGRVFTAKGKLLLANVKATHRVFGQAVSPGCRRPKVCTVVLSRLLSKLADDETVIDSLRWSSLWETYIGKVEVDEKDSQRQLCSPCYFMVTSTRPEEFQREFFNDLPAMVGVTVENWAGKLSDNDDGDGDDDDA
ncbi:hypothetical protein C8Q78DRAFT_978850 [Trametes maxima]|nr:hypothetical protein C8Q78DRAFT_978850 [Trametes maxima]